MHTLALVVVTYILTPPTIILCPVYLIIDQKSVSKGSMKGVPVPAMFVCAHCHEWDGREGRSWAKANLVLKLGY